MMTMMPYLKTEDKHITNFQSFKYLRDEENYYGKLSYELVSVH